MTGSSVWLPKGEQGDPGPQGPVGPVGPPGPPGIPGDTVIYPHFVSVRDYVLNPDGVTSNQVALQQAINKAVADGASLLWPAGTYVSTGSLTNFKSVIHTGPGVIKRGVELFYITPKPNQTNNLYISTTGVDTNDGISSGFPTLTLQAAVNHLDNFGPTLGGLWKIQVAAGTYNQSTTFPSYLAGLERVQILGPAAGTPNVPTAIFDGGGTFSFGLNFLGGNKMLLQDLKFQNYLDYGWVAADINDMYALNVHVANITGGRGLAFHFQEGRIRVYGGKADSCSTAGASLISQTTVTISSLTNDLAGGYQITNCPVGITAQEASTGHIDYVTITGGYRGIDIVQQSRFNSSGCSISGQSDACVAARLLSNWLNFGNNTLTPGAGGVRTKFLWGSGETNEVNDSVQERRVVFDPTAASLTGTIANTVLKTYTGLVKANSFDWAGRKLRVVIRGNFTGGVNTKTIFCYLGGNLIFGLTSIVSSTGFFRYEGELNSITSASQTYSVFMLDTTNQNAPVSPCKGDVGNRAYNLNTGVDLTLSINGQLANANDGININTVEIYETA